MDKKLWIASIAFSVIGALDSLYLTWSKLTHTDVFCGGSNQCETVQNSSYAEFAGIPVAILGLAAYLVIVAIHALEGRGGVWKEYGPLAVFGLSLVGFLYSAYLTYVELAILHAVCPYCVVSAVAITLVFIVSIVRLVKAPSEPEPNLKRVRARGG